MKTLLLMRHAKSSWKDPDLEDHERPLNKRGKKDAPMIGSLLQDRELVPQLILCSTAVRSKLTAEAIVEASGFDGEIRYLDSFYLAEPYTYIQELSQVEDRFERVMVIGHNPGLEGALQMLSGQVESLPTAALAYLVLPIQSWSEISPEVEGDLVEFWRPRELKEKSKK